MAIPVAKITDPSWAKALWKFSGRDGVVDFWINDEGDFGLDPISRKEQKYIRSTLATIDNITGLKFKERGSWRRTDVDVSSISRFGDPDVLGTVYMQRDWYEIVFRNFGGRRLRRKEKLSIAHEIGHVLGLNEPGGDGFDAEYSTRDTIMSYNDAGFHGFTGSDRRALASLWSNGSFRSARAALKWERFASGGDEGMSALDQKVFV